MNVDEFRTRGAPIARIRPVVSVHE